ncbi:MAG: DUF2520 domain-containing protein [Glaciimonas sp.]|nr:DUF2520 domain-containing protein [Glaciimonas sp.]
MAGTAGSNRAVGKLNIMNVRNNINDDSNACLQGGTTAVLPTLTILGCGKVGKTLARLWCGRHTARKHKVKFTAPHQVFQIRDVMNRSHISAQQACDFIGDGRAVTTYAELDSADIYLITVGDDHIAGCCADLAASGRLTSNNIVFHCSGALSSLALIGAIQQGAAVASIHPIRSFANPQQVVQDFTGTYCGIEGDTAALAVLAPAFDAIGARCVVIQRDKKIIYHAAAVFASNYLVTLIEVARQAYVEAGLPSNIALQLIAPLLSESAENAFSLGPATALTGPIARGDMTTVARQYDALQQEMPDVAALYRQFEILTLALAQKKV